MHEVWVVDVSEQSLAWHIASRCDNVQCVAIARDPGSSAVFMRSTRPDSPDHLLTFSAESFTSFLEGAKAGEFDQPIA